ncbi:MAG: adenosylcobalamin-dependent ribonucleoside-diphosphate reductase, partial [Steroidobacteraceae bacterium]|nr:adenosylcobalamin-dependent ribonucleoside-diphosphate reductase [Steroidobacteraceae bacterium]
DRPWILIFAAPADAGRPELIVERRVPARDIWHALCANAHTSAEPGVLFIDRINEMNNLGYREQLSATNPCAEVPLPPYGACHLGSLNVASFVRDPFTPQATVDFALLERTAAIAVRFLDNVIDIARYPLFRQRQAAHASRRIGLGLTGLADALIMLGLRYDSPPARALAARIGATIRDAAYTASIELARERGTFPLFDATAHVARPFIQALPASIRGDIARYGIRNSHLLAVAPAGSISLLANNVSSGIEPVFGLTAVRRILNPDGSATTCSVTDYAYRLWSERHAAGTPLPDYLIDGRSVAPRDHLLMQAALQPYIDGAISKTVIFDRRATPEDIAATLLEADALGLKGCTVFRIGARQGVFVESSATDDAMMRPRCTV